MPCKLFPFSSKTVGGWDKHDQQIRTPKNWGTIISINRLLLEWLHLFILLPWGSLFVHFTFCWHPGVGITWSYRYSLAALTVELVSFWYVLVGSMLELMLKLFMHYTWVFSYRRAQLGFQLQTQIAGTEKAMNGSVDISHKRWMQLATHRFQETHESQHRFGGDWGVPVPYYWPYVFDDPLGKYGKNHESAHNTSCWFQRCLWKF